MTTRLYRLLLFLLGWLMRRDKGIAIGHAALITTVLEEHNVSWQRGRVMACAVMKEIFKVEIK